MIAYSQFMEHGRLMQEIDGLDIMAYLDVLAWRAGEHDDREPAKTQRYIDDFT